MTRSTSKATSKATSRSTGASGRRRGGTPAADTSGGDGSSPAEETEIRVRMYRVGFGDFFLLTVPGRDGPAHILIDCGVHAKPIGSMDQCVRDLKEVTGNRLALVILTHYHADHMSGFATNYDDFASFDVGAVWITNRLDPGHEQHAALMGHLTTVATQLRTHLAARTDPAAAEAAAKVDNALGFAAGVSGGANAKALQLLQSGFQGNPPVYYYEAGDEPTLPDELDGVLTAEILAPAPLDSGGEFADSDNRAAQYFAAVSQSSEIPHASGLRPFEKAWPAAVRDFPIAAFDEFDTGLSGPDHVRAKDGARQLAAALASHQPDALLAAADQIDGTLNNQSLVVLFTCQGKKLLFVGDAQWGNWASWLYGRKVSGPVPDMTERARDILASIDFYKVGHHGSTNATPIPVVGALNESCAAMCSTAVDAYGSPEKHTEVPRTALLDALQQRTGHRTVRSDWVGGPGVDPAPEARDGMDTLPTGFSASDEFYIDYVL